MKEFQGKPDKQGRMRNSWPALVLLSVLWGCGPLPPDGNVTGTPTPDVVASQTSTPKPVPSGSATPAAKIPAPDFPAQVFKPLKPIAALEPKMQDTEVWFADSGIKDNRLGYYVTNDDLIEAEARLKPTFIKDKEPYLEGVGPIFNFQNGRVGLVRRKGSAVCEFFMLVPLSNPPKVPACLKEIKLPAIPEASLRGGKTLVVLATGEGLGEHVDHMLANAGLVITPTPTATPTATPTPTTSPTP